MEYIQVSDLRQYEYCPRILYFKYVVPASPPSTYSMKRGLSLQERFENLEPRRTLSRYGLEKAERRFRVRLSDPDIKLTGEIDLLLVGSETVAPVEFKSGDTKFGGGHSIQLKAYAFLAEQNTSVTCKVGFICYHDQKTIIPLTFSKEDFKEVKEKTNQIREIIASQNFPLPTLQQKKCLLCEFKNFCGDIF